MVATYLRDAGRRVVLISAATLSAMAFIAAYVSTALAGTKTGTALALAVTIGPILLVAALVAPMIFPFSLYAFLTPFDSVLVFTKGGDSGGGAASTVTMLAGLASGAAMLFYMLRTKRFADPPREVVVWLLYYLWMVASAFWAIDVNSTFKLLPTVVSLFVLYAVVSMMRIDTRTLRTISGAILAGSSAASAYMLYLYTHGMAQSQARLWLRNDTVNVNPDHFAASLLLPIGLAAIVLLHSRSLWVRVLTTGAMGLMLAVMVLSGARGPQLGMAVMLAYIMIRDANRWRLIVPLGALAALVIARSGEAFFGRWGQAMSDAGSGRGEIWRVGWLAFKQNWLFGAGFNNFPLAYNQAFIQVFQPFNRGWDRGPHNILLSCGVELGIIGLVLLLLAWFVQFRMLRYIDSSDPRYPMRLAVEGAVIALFVCGIFATEMETKYVWLAFMIGLLIRNTRIQPQHA